MKKQEDYTAKDIYVLKGLQPVRKRPAMYIGSTDIDGLHHLIWEIVDNSLDEALAGHAKNIKLELLKGKRADRVKISDDGRGIPVDVHSQTKKSALETVMCTLHAGGKFGKKSYKIAGGLHGVGVSVVNALSSYLKAEVCRGGFLYSQEYKQGKPVSKIKKIGRCQTNGTVITFDPDPEIFSVLAKSKEGIKFNLKKILNHLRQQAYLTSGIRFEIIDSRETPPSIHDFCFEGGLTSFVEYLAGANKPIQSNFFNLKKEINGFQIEVTFTYTKEIESSELSFANHIYTPDGGAHLTGFRSALTRAINEYAKTQKSLKEKDINLSGDDVREGLIAVISLKLPEPQFEGQTKARLGNPEARTVVEAAVGEELKEFFERYPKDAAAIIEKCLLAAKARKAAKAAKETVLRKGALDGFTLPGKLSDCSSKDPEESELFIVEGESAGGSSRMARDRRIQAILPLKGKILNVEKTRLDKILANQEIKSLIMAIGTAIGESFNLAGLRYNKIIILSDADIDGSHIKTLLLTLFYRYFKPIIERGNLYIACPPLYRLQIRKEVFYVFTDKEKDDILKRSLQKGKDEEAMVQRFKGLGEMNPEQLWETTMNPEKRILKKITIEEAIEADRLFDILMGEEVAPRKEFILTYAREVKNLDV